MSASVQGTLLALGEQSLDTVHGRFTAHRFENLLDRRPMIALTRGDVRNPAPLLARVHSACITSEAFGGRDCDCAEQLSHALAEVDRGRRGVLFYLMQEGRGAGFAAKARDRMLVQASRHRLTTFEAYEQMGLGRDLRRYDEVGFACRLLGITAPLTLLTNNPDKVAALEATNLPVAGTRSLAGSTSPFNRHYIDAKRSSGHALDGAKGELQLAELPEAVERFEPAAVAGDPTMVRLASYLLPIRAHEQEVVWFRVHAYFDVAARIERVLLTLGHLGDRAPLVTIHEEDLLDRFPLRSPGPARRRWHTLVQTIAAWGAGCVLFGGAETPSAAKTDIRRAAALIARHLPGDRARTIPGEDGADPLGHALNALGIEVEGRAVLAEG